MYVKNVFYVVTVHQHKTSLSATKVKPYPNELKKFTPSPFPGDYYRWTSEQNTTSGTDFTHLSSSVPSDCFTDSKSFSSNTDEKRTRNSVIGVLRLQDSMKDNTSVNDESSFLNDLSSLDHSGISAPEVPVRQCLSFKNI